ncbi:unnamed protein product [Plutella xylostella]|uniref:(diamondback moth) hypothetical protein n=1 Tax=Plutella xylostella TaxID=51655 RepID=A0A8S4D306_PLUXY|nr:unnamed protein product [Plutella xylostella]
MERYSTALRTIALSVKIPTSTLLGNTSFLEHCCSSGTPLKPANEGKQEVGDPVPRQCSLWTTNKGKPEMKNRGSPRHRTLNWHPWRSALLGVGAMSQTDHARVALWDVPPIREVHEAVVSPGRYHVDSMLFSPRSGELVLSLWNSERDAATDLAKGSRIVVLSSPDSIVDQWGEGRYYLDRVRTMVFSPDGTKLATATTEEDLIIWNFLPEDKKQKGYFKRRFCDLPVHFDETSFGISKR